MQLALTILSIISILFGLYFVYTCAAGLLRRNKPEIAPSAPTRRIAAVIAARNEESVIGELVGCLLAQKYPRELFDVFVIPNNCSDGTEEAARAAGGKIIHCTVPVHSKGDALKFAFEQLTSMENGYDAYCIFDADNLVDPMFFQAVNDARAAGWHAAQGYRDSKNPYDNFISGCMSVFYWFMSRFYNTSRSALGMSCALNGTGFMVSDELIRRMGWNTITLTEDLEFSALCALEDVKIGWMPRARIFDEQPGTFHDSVMQRRRWSAGSLQCLKHYGVRLFAKRTSHSIDMGVLFTGMLLNLVGVFSFLLTGCLTVRNLIAAPETLVSTLLIAAGSVLACWLLMAAACALLFRLEGKLNARCIPAVLAFGPFMLTWMIINLSCFFTRPPKWVAIHHGGNHTVSG